MNLKLLMEIYNSDSPNKTTQVTVGRYEAQGLLFTIKTLTNSEMYEIQKESIDEAGKMDNELYNVSLLEHAMVDYNPKDVTVRESFGAYSSQEVLDAMFLPTEMIKLVRLVDSFSMKGKLPDEAPTPKLDLKK